MVVGTELWGFVTPSTVDLTLVRNATAKVQPYYALPKQYLAMDDFPMTRNGKIDKRSLAGLAESDNYEGVKRLSVHERSTQQLNCALTTNVQQQQQQPSFKLVKPETASPLSPESIPRSSSDLKDISCPDQSQMVQDGPESSYVLNDVPRMVYVDAV